VNDDERQASPIGRVLPQPLHSALHRFVASAGCINEPHDHIGTDGRRHHTAGTDHRAGGSGCIRECPRHVLFAAPGERTGIQRPAQLGRDDLRPVEHHDLATDSGSRAG
jgi:hypothetical protein